MKKNSFKKASIAFLAIALMFGITAKAITTLNFGNADSFAILAGSGITVAGAVNTTTITGDIGTFPTPAITGLGNVVLGGTNHAGDAVTQNAKNDLVTAYNFATSQTPVSMVATELGETTKTAGIYNSASGTFGITGTLTLDAQNDPNAIFIFKTASTLITASGSNVVLANGAQACNVFWQVGSSATLGTNSTFKGTIMALESAILTTGASVNGRILARNGAVTLDSNTITKSTCAVPIVTPTPEVTPEPVLISEPTRDLTPTPVIAVPDGAVSLANVVATPKLPSTGIVPDSLNNSWGIVIPIGVLFIIFSLYLILKKRSV